ncbi:MAG TPA: hypothetical protein VIU41_05815 [Geobacteraceae bacterium]
MSATTLKTAGWLAMISAIITLPLVYLSFRLEGQSDLTAQLLETTIQVLGIVIFVAVTILLKRFLNSTFNFHLTDRLIKLMIKANIVICVMAILSLYLKTLQESLSVFIVVMVVVLGIMQTMFGYQLRRLPNDLGGMLKPYCYLNMAIGITSASVVLVPVAVVLSAIADVMLGTIFFQAARRAAENTAEEPP